MSCHVQCHTHHPPVIDGVTYDKLQAVTSVVGSGVYMSDQDAHEGDQILVYTGVFSEKSVRRDVCVGGCVCEGCEGCEVV